MTTDLFVCHSSKDKAFADQLVEGIEKHGVGCWIAPRNILSGQKWGGAIMRALEEECKALIFILSDDSNKSDQVLTELETAKDRRMPIIPVNISQLKLQELSYDVRYFVRSHQWIEAANMPLDQVVFKILASLKGIVDIPEKEYHNELPEKVSSITQKSLEVPPEAPTQQLCRFLIYDKVISSLDDIPAIGELDGNEHRLIIIAEDFSGEAEKYLNGAEYSGLMVQCLKAPGFGDRRKSILQDIAICTGATTISEEKGLQLSLASPEDLGASESIHINHALENQDMFKSRFGNCNTLIHGQGSAEDIEDRIKHIQWQIENTTSDYDREKLEDQLSSFQNTQSGTVDYIFDFKE